MARYDATQLMDTIALATFEQELPRLCVHVEDAGRVRCLKVVDVNCYDDKVEHTSGVMVIADHARSRGSANHPHDSFWNGRSRATHSILTHDRGRGVDPGVSPPTLPGLATQHASPSLLSRPSRSDTAPRWTSPGATVHEPSRERRLVANEVLQPS